MPEFGPAATRVRESLGSMSFLEHLEELRRRIIYSAISVAVVFLQN